MRFTHALKDRRFRMPEIAANELECFFARAARCWSDPVEGKIEIPRECFPAEGAAAIDGVVAPRKVRRLLDCGQIVGAPRHKRDRPDRRIVPKVEKRIDG